MAINQEQIKELLGTGLSNEVVASAVGCDPAYISQLMADEDFASVVIEKRSKSLTAHTARDLTIDGIEDRLLEKLSSLIDQNAFYKPADVLRAVSVVNKLVRRGVPVNQQLTARAQVINLSIPDVVKRAFTLNAQGQIVDAGEQTLVTMSSVELLQKLSATKGKPDAPISGDGGRTADSYGALAGKINKDQFIDV